MASGRGFWLAVALGGALVAFGVRGLLEALPGEQLGSWLSFWLGGLLAHDLVLAPLAAGAGVLLARRAPAHVRPPLQGAALVTAAIVLATLPLLLGEGRQPDNPSLQPNDYTANVLLVAGAAWAVGGVLALRRARRGPPPGGQ